MEQTKKINPYLVGGGALLALVAAFVLTRGTNGKKAASGPEAESTEQPSDVASTPPAQVRFKVPVSTMQPFEGPVDALVTMVEWCDLRGTACREGDAVLTQLMKEYNGRLRRVYRLVPNSSRPEEAKAIHQLARAAYEDGKNSQRFLEVRKQLLAVPDGTTIGAAELASIAQKSGMDYAQLAPKLRDEQFMGALGLDSNFAVRFGVSELPAVYVNGRPLPKGSTGSRLKSALKQLIDEELVNAEQSLGKGVAKAALYDKLTENGLWSLDDNPRARQANAAAAKQSVARSLSFDSPAGKP